MTRKTDDPALSHHVAHSEMPRGNDSRWAEGPTHDQWRESRGPVKKGRGLILLVVIAVAIGLAVGLRSLVPDPPILELELPGRLALLPMANGTGEAEFDWVAHGLVEMMTESLARTPGVELVPPGRVHRLLAGRALDPAAEESLSRARELARALGAEVVVETRLRLEGRAGAVSRSLGGPPPLAYALDVSLYPRQGEAIHEELEGTDPIDLANRLIVSLARSQDSEGEPGLIETVFSSSRFLDQLYGMGLHALATVGPSEARKYFSIACEHRPYFLAAKLELAKCERLLGNLEAGQSLAREILEEAQARGEQRLQVAALAEQARIAAVEGNQEAAAELFGQAGALLAKIGDDAWRSEITFELARLSLARDDSATARRLFEDRLELQRRLADRPGQIDSLMELASLSLSEGAMDVAEQALSEAEALAREIGDLWLEMKVTASRGELARKRGDTEEAIAHWNEALAFYRQRGDIPRQLLLSRKLSEAHLEQRRYDEAEDLLHASLEMARSSRRPAMEAAASLRLAWLLLRTGYPLQARSHVERALELDRWIVEDRLALQLVIAWLAYEQGNYRLALETQLEAKRQAEDSWRPLDEEFLKVYRRAAERGARLPVPGEGAT